MAAAVVQRRCPDIFKRPSEPPPAVFLSSAGGGSECDESPFDCRVASLVSANLGCCAVAQHGAVRKYNQTPGAGTAEIGETLAVAVDMADVSRHHVGGAVGCESDTRDGIGVRDDPSDSLGGGVLECSRAGPGFAVRSHRVKKTHTRELKRFLERDQVREHIEDGRVHRNPEGEHPDQTAAFWLAGARKLVDTLEAVREPYDRPARTVVMGDSEALRRSLRDPDDTVHLRVEAAVPGPSPRRQPVAPTLAPGIGPWLLQLDFLGGDAVTPPPVRASRPRPSRSLQ
ncbi:hypothetical protein OG285_32580 [Streptomyces sp. NBC_01471]|uniref:hypothetical protein n=1 Tax=Streptomyces sp. NBC_01471 TaxID=2903879 RepID=UPI003251C130